MALSADQSTNKPNYTKFLQKFAQAIKTKDLKLGESSFMDLRRMLEIDTHKGYTLNYDILRYCEESDATELAQIVKDKFGDLLVHGGKATETVQETMTYFDKKKLVNILKAFYYYKSSEEFAPYIPLVKWLLKSDCTQPSEKSKIHCAINLLLKHLITFSEAELEHFFRTSLKNYKEIHGSFLHIANDSSATQFYKEKFRSERNSLNTDKYNPLYIALFKALLPLSLENMYLVTHLTSNIPLFVHIFTTQGPFILLVVIRSLCIPGTYIPENLKFIDCLIQFGCQLTGDMVREVQMVLHQSQPPLADQLKLLILQKICPQKYDPKIAQKPPS